jgi:hypothetical protein
LLAAGCASATLISTGIFQMKMIAQNRVAGQHWHTRLNRVPKGTGEKSHVRLEAAQMLGRQDILKVLCVL